MSAQKKYRLSENLARYKIKEFIGEGKLSQVYLAEDPICHRTVALKVLKKEFQAKSHFKQMFLQEAKVISQLTHSSIIPIYSIHDEPNQTYFTMPLVKGESLSNLLSNNFESRNYRENNLLSISSIYSLILIFLNLCYAIKYCHLKGVLHCNLKPDSIIVQNSAQITLIDWEMAKSKDQVQATDSNNTDEWSDRITSFDFLEPECVLGSPSSCQSDIYSLGAILYYMLTLKKPFNRPNDFKEWKNQIIAHGLEDIINPQKEATDREITPQLASIALKCLAKQKYRYKNLDEIINDLQNYIQGKPEWFLLKDYHIETSSDWEFQENILLSRHMAISRYGGTMEWVMLMLSKDSFYGNIRLEAKIQLKENCNGIGFMLSVPVKMERKSIENGYVLWLGSKNSPGCKFFRNNVSLRSKDNIYLTPNREYQILVERIDKDFRILIDGEEILSYKSYIPVLGGHFGILFRDTYFNTSPISVFSGSLNAQVNCLSIPDTFLMIKDYDKALTEYKDIADSFTGRTEGREAIFRSGLTLIMMGKGNNSLKRNLLEKALIEFEKLSKTPGAPLEYLGKALVYQAENNLEEETKCLELAIRMFPKHPLIHLLKEHLIFRLFETGQKDRVGAYTYALITIRQISSVYQTKEAQQFFKQLTSNWEEIPFFTNLSPFSDEKIEKISLSIKIAFWLARPISLYELSLEIPYDHKQRPFLLENILYSLMAIGYPNLINYILNTKLKDDHSISNLKKDFIILNLKKPLEEKLALLNSTKSVKFIYPFLKKHMTIKKAPTILSLLKEKNFPRNLYIWALLLSNKYNEADSLLKNEDTLDISSDFFMLRGCCLAALEGESASKEFFAQLIDASHPKIPTLLGHFLKGNIDLKKKWVLQSFFWEKLELFKQLSLYYHCLKLPNQALHYEEMITKEISKLQIPLNFI